MTEKHLSVVRSEPSGIALFEAHDPTEIMRRASQVAGPLADHIQKRGLSRKFGGDKAHVYVEGWYMAATMTGVYAEVLRVDPFTDDRGEGGYLAVVTAKTAAGQTIGHAEAICTRSEATWKNKPSYALYSMAQTRATSRALRAGLGWIMELAGYDPTPAEEAEGIEFQTIDAGATTGVPVSDGAVVNREERRELRDAAAAAGLTSVEAAALVKATCGVESSAQVPRNRLADVLVAFAATGPAPDDPPEEAHAELFAPDAKPGQYEQDAS